MTNPFDPRAGAPDLSQLWPSFGPDDSPYTPAEWAQALADHGSGAPSPFPPREGQASDVDENGQTPPHVLAAQILGGPGQTQGGDGPVGVAGPLQYGGNPSAYDGDPTGWRPLPARYSGPPPASSRLPQPIENAGATAPTVGPGLSGGSDDLVRAFAGPRLDHNPFGFVVDPQTGAVSRWTSDPGGDLEHPKGLRLEPVDPADKQRFLEWMVGARANYPLGQTSPEEQAARFELQQGGLLGAKGPPISATASGKTVTYQNPDGSTFPLSGVPAIRDSNPRNIDWSAFAVRHGAIGRDGRHAIFPSDDQAYQASMALMSSMAANGREWPGYPAGTLGNIVRQWSPPNENGTEHMIKNISDMTGLDRNAKWESLTPEQKDAFARAYARVEGYKGFAPDLPASVR